MHMVMKICTLLIILILPLNSEGQKTPEDVLRAAEEGLRVWVTNMLNAPHRAEKRYGVKNLDNISSASLGEPFKRYKIDVRDLSVFSEGSDFSSLCKFYSYRFPIILNQDIKGFISIRFVHYIEGKEEGTWHWTMMGQNNIKENMIYDLKEMYRHQNEQVLAFFIHEQSLSFFLIKKNGNYFVMPSSERAASLCGFEKDEGDWYSPAPLKEVLWGMKAFARHRVKLLDEIERLKKDESFLKSE